METDATSKTTFIRRFWWILCVLPVALLVTAIFIRPIQLNLGDKSFALSIQSLVPKGAFADEGVFIRTGWDGPTGAFSHGDIFGIKLGRLLLRLDILEDPIAAAQRRLPKTLAGLIETLESKDHWLKSCAWQALADLGASAQPALPAMIKAMEHGGEEAQRALSTVSKAAGAKSVPTLTNALASLNARGRQSIAEILGEIGPEAKSAVPSLQGRLRDVEPRVVTQSALALWKIDRQTHGAVLVLVKLLAHGNAEVRAAAVVALGEFGSESAEAVPALLRTLEDSNSHVRAMSARTLGMIGPAARLSIPRLKAQLEETSGEVLMWTVHALGQFGKEASEAVPNLTELIVRDNDSARWAIAALAEMGTNAVPVLVELYRDDERGHRYFIAKALTKLGTEAEAAVPVMMADLNSENMGRVAMAAHVLGHLGKSARIALPRLTELLASDNAHVRVRVAGALWKLDEQMIAALPVLLAALRDDSIERAGARRFAVEALAELGPAAGSAVPLLEAMLTEQHSSLRPFVAEALRKITGREVELPSQPRAGRGTNLRGSLD